MKQPITYAQDLGRFRAAGLRFGNAIIEAALAQDVLPSDAEVSSIIERHLFDLASQRPDADEVEAFAHGLKDLLMVRHPSLVQFESEPTGADGLSPRFLAAFAAQSEGVAWEMGRALGRGEDFRALRDALVSHLRCSLGDYAARQRPRRLAAMRAIPLTASARAGMQPEDVAATLATFLSLTFRAGHPSPQDFADSCRVWRETTLALAPDQSPSIEIAHSDKPWSGQGPSRRFSPAAAKAMARVIQEEGIAPEFREILANEVSGMAALVTPRQRRPHCPS